MDKPDTPVIDFKSVKDVVVEAWRLSWDLLAAIAQPDWLEDDHNQL